MREGMSCLRTLDTAQSRAMIEKFEELRSFWGYFEVTCPADLTKEMSRIAAAESFHYSSGIRPQVELNIPGILDMRNSRRVLSSAVFHELIHHLGYSHGRDIDYPYACEFHCFPPEDVSPAEYAPEMRKSAKAICSGEFGDPGDLEYLRQLTNMMYVAGGYTEFRLKTLFDFARRRVGARPARLLLAMNLVNAETRRIAIALGERWRGLEPTVPLSAREKEWVHALERLKVDWSRSKDDLEPVTDAAVEAFDAILKPDSAWGDRVRAVAAYSEAWKAARDGLEKNGTRMSPERVEDLERLEKVLFWASIRKARD